MRIPDDWPDAELAELLPIYAKTLRDDPHVHPDYRDRGYAAEAVRALVAWAQGQDGVARVTARCDSENIPSVRVLAKAGLEHEGELNGLSRWVTAARPRIRRRP